MTYRYLTQLADVLRAADLKVVEVPGWKTRGRPSSTGGFDPVGVLWHHTGAKDTNPHSIADDKAYAEWLAEIGRSDLPAPLCQLSIGRDGTVYVCAAGRGNHAGKAKASGSVAAGDGNQLYIGVECQNTGSEGWPAAQRDAMVTTGAVLATKVLHTSAQAQRGHRETSVTGKWDPGKLDLDEFRADVAAEITALLRPAKPDPEPTRVEDARALLEAALKRAKAPARRKRLRAALDALPKR